MGSQGPRKRRPPIPIPRPAPPLPPHSPPPHPCPRTGPRPNDWREAGARPGSDYWLGLGRGRDGDDSRNISNNPTTTEKKERNIRNTDSDIVTVPFGSPHSFPNCHFLSNKLLLGYPQVPGAQLEFINPRLPLFLRPVVFYQFDHINIVSPVYF